jgi:uncharacterized protein YutE (UPF0331/DUF86 family)
LNAIADAVKALKELRPLPYDEFAREHVLHGSAERDFQVAIQAALDIGTYLLADAGVPVPSEYQQVFRALGQIGAIPQTFADKLMGMAKFRNVLVHLYLEVDLSKVYHYIQSDLDDFVLFATYVGDYIAQRQGDESP